MAADPDLIQQAAGGSTAAQLGLTDLALAAGESGAIRRIEALVAAEVWARLAAARGGIEENRALASVLLSRGEFEMHQCRDGFVRWYDGEARRVLKVLAALDDADAKQALVELGPPGEDEHHEPDVGTQRRFALAAAGDLAAFGALYDDAVRLLAEGGTDPIEVLTAAELYARLGSASAEPDYVRRLAGILLKRAEYEYREGWSAIGDNAMVEATILLSILVDVGDHSMATWLSMLVADAPKRVLASAAEVRPTLLKFIDPEGTC